MKIRLSGGLVASGRHAWIAGPSGPRRLLDGSDARPGAAVALGPEDAPEEDAAHAVEELSLLVADGGAVAAGAGVDLGAGFRSARLDGARGDQRDAALAALRAVGVRNAHRLGERSGFLVALFGPAVTKRVGAAAARAAEDGRWAALHLASAASDVLGPEQLERVLALEAPDADLAPDGPPSVLALYLRQVLGDVPRPRRLALILDLWARVLEHRDGLARRAARLATQGRRDRLDDLRKRRRYDERERILGRLRADLGIAEPSVADAALWIPDAWYWRDRLDRALQDALGATALLRTAVAVADHGLEDGLERSVPVLRAAAAMLPESAAARSARRVPGLTGLPVRPAAYVRDLLRRATGSRPRDARAAGSVRPRLACARDFALVVIEDVERVIREIRFHEPDGVLRSWAESNLGSWREGAGYVRPPAEWAGIPDWTGPALGDREPLRDRLAPSGEPASVELVGDLLWYADLIDALARLYGHELARPTARHGRALVRPRPAGGGRAADPAPRLGHGRRLRRRAARRARRRPAPRAPHLGGPHRGPDVGHRDHRRPHRRLRRPARARGAGRDGRPRHPGPAQDRPQCPGRRRVGRLHGQLHRRSRLRRRRQGGPDRARGPLRRRRPAGRQRGTGPAAARVAGVAGRRDRGEVQRHAGRGPGAPVPRLGRHDPRHRPGPGGPGAGGAPARPDRTAPRHAPPGRGGGPGAGRPRPPGAGRDRPGGPRHLRRRGGDRAGRRPRPAAPPRRGTARRAPSAAPWTGAPRISSGCGPARATVPSPPRSTGSTPRCAPGSTGSRSFSASPRCRRRCAGSSSAPPSPTPTPWTWWRGGSAARSAGSPSRTTR
ncbi:hypothetical protein LUX57_08695 [Actinomadura madurae]|uniref:hypothetical protein n=1 Tax=Actinomadura madurae TaxID=1993 RepID=UPI0020D2022A|nr:hypothetical protein [Actinomadura madurae]MCP9965207.1 hypothetical protein [Actinomadura madurae]